MHVVPSAPATRWAILAAALFGSLVGSGCGSSFLECPESDYEYTLSAASSSEDSTCSDATDERALVYRIVMASFTETTEEWDIFVQSEERTPSGELGCTFLGRGTLRGREVTYSSPPFEEERDDGRVRWSMTGRATLDSGRVLWEGTETISVLESTDASVQTGCDHVQSLAGERSD